MKKIFLILTLSSTYFFISSCGNKKVEEEPPGELDYVLTWSDEFDGETIDAGKWDKPESNRRTLMLIVIPVVTIGAIVLAGYLMFKDWTPY